MRTESTEEAAPGWPLALLNSGLNSIIIMGRLPRPSDPGAADKGLYWNSLPFGELLWILMRILIRIHKNSPNGTEFQGA